MIFSTFSSGWWGATDGVYWTDAWARRKQVHFAVNWNFQCHCFPIQHRHDCRYLWICVSTYGFTAVWFAKCLHMRGCVEFIYRLTPQRFAGKPKNKHGRKKNSRTLLFFHIERRFACLKGRKSHYNMSLKELRKFSYQIIANWAHQTRCNAQVPPRLSEWTCSNSIALTHVFEGKLELTFWFSVTLKMSREERCRW